MNQPAAVPSPRSERERVNLVKLAKRLRRGVGEAIQDYNMIEDGDRVLVCLSGGKDSYTMLDILRSLQQSAPVRFELFAVNLDQKQPGFPANVLPDYLASIGQPFEIIEQDTYSVVQRVVPEGKTTCSLCSRLRRGILYTYAHTHGFSKIALGHHRDDILETLLLNLFYGGSLKAMPPKLRSDDGRNVVIRPLAYCKEKDIERYAAAKGFPIIPCNLCGSQPNLQRAVIGDMLRDWDRRHPGRLESMFSAVKNVAPSQLADAGLFDFAGLGATAAARRDWLVPARETGDDAAEDRDDPAAADGGDGDGGEPRIGAGSGDAGGPGGVRMFRGIPIGAG
ncbi:MAG: tRNA 2-thiocytidine(32) synthetase TtcA [Proteobacteria bacterium]|nr:tRNA 2-thiocytidine(32) synthetase TtcA [Pseudomonadota bacterium]